MINNVVLTGRLAEIPELCYTTNNKAVTRFTIAVDRPYRKDVEKQADFIRIIVWGTIAEFVCKYFTKGQKIAVIGCIRTGSYLDKVTGAKKYTFEILAERVDFVESKSQSTTSDKSKDSSKDYQSSTPQTKAEESYDYESAQQQFEDIPYSDDLPF